MNVASTSPSFAMSAPVSTPVASRTPRPNSAIAVESMWNVPATAHPATIATNVPVTIFSARLSGPSAASASRAAAGAPGVARTSGAVSLKSTNGSSAIAASVGTDEASSHDPKPISTPKVRAISAPSGFAAIAVNQSADDRLRLAIPENIRKVPRRGRPPGPGFTPAAWHSE